MRSPEGRSVGSVTLADGAPGKVAFESRAAELLQEANVEPVGAVGLQRVPDASSVLPHVVAATIDIDDRKHADAPTDGGVCLEAAT